MIVTLNGEPHEVSDDATVATLLSLLGSSPGARGVAVAVAGEVIPRGRWTTTSLGDGDQIEVVAAIQGG